MQTFAGEGDRNNKTLEYRTYTTIFNETYIKLCIISLIQKRQILPTQFCISAFKFFAGTKEDAGTTCMLDPEVTVKVDILGSQNQIFVTVTRKMKTCLF